MNIREQIHTETDLNLEDHHIDNLETVVLNISIQFAEWMSGLIESNYCSKGSWYVPRMDRIMSSKELFELFKKENGI